MIPYINSKAPNIPYTAWDLLEHMRIAQRDILDFIKIDDYIELNWPDDYWPDKNVEATEKEWSASIKMFFDDLNEIKQIVANPEIDLFISLPHGDEYNILREVLLVADHNSYHLGQLMSLQRALKSL